MGKGYEHQVLARILHISTIALSGISRVCGLLGWASDELVNLLDSGFQDFGSLH